MTENLPMLLLLIRLLLAGAWFWWEEGEDLMMSSVMSVSSMTPMSSSSSEAPSPPLTKSPEQTEQRWWCWGNKSMVVARYRRIEGREKWSKFLTFSKKPRQLEDISGVRGFCCLETNTRAEVLVPNLLYLIYLIYSSLLSDACLKETSRSSTSKRTKSLLEPVLVSFRRESICFKASKRSSWS